MRYFSLLIIFFPLFVFNTAGQTTAAKLVKQSFTNYKNAILNDKGQEAVKYVDSRTIKYYQDALELVKTADSSEVDALPILDKLMVFSIRHRTSKEDILSLDGKGLFVYAVKSGMVGKNSVAPSLGIVTVNKNFAKAPLVVNGKVSPLYMDFYKEEEQWKMDLTSVFPVTRKVFQDMVDDSGEAANEYIFSILELLTGKKPGPEIWQPVK